jgi:hypothetical protein
MGAAGVGGERARTTLAATRGPRRSDKNPARLIGGTGDLFTPEGQRPKRRNITYLDTAVAHTKFDGESYKFGLNMCAWLNLQRI